MKNLKSQATTRSNAVTFPSLANNPYASLLDLRDSTEPASLISSRLAVAGSKRKGRIYRKV
eukprot:781008-Rhodomonas_salina.1